MPAWIRYSNSTSRVEPRSFPKERLAYSGIMKVLPLFLALATAATCYGQKPMIFPGGVVNAANYTTGGPGGKSVAPGSIVSVFGKSLASVETSAQSYPLPRSLAGVSVLINGVAAPLFYVS